jgi:hypothetical protein
LNGEKTRVSPNLRRDVYLYLSNTLLTPSTRMISFTSADKEAK